MFRLDAVLAGRFLNFPSILQGGLIASLLATNLTIFNATAYAGDGNEFPVPRAEPEFIELLEVPRGFASQNDSSVVSILTAMQPYGPLDLQITGAATHKEISELKNFYFGVTTGILGISPNTLGVLIDCDKKCLRLRRNEIADNLPAFIEVADNFRSANGVKLVGAWGGNAMYRVNDVTQMGNMTLAAVPSVTMGFIPGGRFTEQASLQAALAEREIDPAKVTKLVDSMVNAGAVAVHYGTAGRVEVIRMGLVDNFSGVFFVDSGQAVPAKGDEHPGGGHFSTVERISDNAYFFETR